MAGAATAIADDVGGWEPGEGEWRAWPAAFLAVLAAHAAIAFLVLRSVDLSPDGGVALPQPTFDVSIHMQEVVGNQLGTSEILTPGDETEMAGASNAPEALDPVEPAAEQPIESEVLETTRADDAEPVRSEMLSSVDRAEPVERETPGVSRPQPLRSEALPPAEAPLPTTDAAGRVAAADAPSAVPEETLAPATIAQELAPDLPGDPVADEPVAALEPVPVEPAAPPPTPAAPAVAAIEPETPAVTSPSGEVIETTDLAPLPRARPAAVPEEFLREYERQQREAEQRRIAEREAAERREAEQRETEERQAAAETAPAEQSAEPSPPRRQQSGGGASSAGATQNEAGAGAADTASYQRRVFRHLQRYKRFPRGEDAGGTATVRFTVNSAGAASGVRLVQGSGSPALDQATLEMVSRASPFPPLPAGLGTRMTFAVPVSYSVR